MRTYNEGDVICTIGDPPDDLRIVQSGTVRWHAHIYIHTRVHDPTAHAHAHATCPCTPPTPTAAPYPLTSNPKPEPVLRRYGDDLQPMWGAAIDAWTEIVKRGGDICVDEVSKKVGR